MENGDRVGAVSFGRGPDAFTRACREHDRCFRAPGDRRYDLVVASAGGYPKDINLIQAHKAIDNAAGFVGDGGTLVLLAECADGVGSAGFLPFFDLKMASVWEPKTERRFARHYMRLHMIIGWILVPIGLLAVSGIIS